MNPDKNRDGTAGAELPGPSPVLHCALLPRRTCGENNAEMRPRFGRGGTTINRVLLSDLFPVISRVAFEYLLIYFLQQTQFCVDLSRNKKQH